MLKESKNNLLHSRGKQTSYRVALDQTQPAWYVIQTFSNHEGKVENGLLKKGFEIFLPRVTVCSRRKDRKKLLNTPLFPGYLFVHTVIWPKDFYKIIKMPGVVRLLGIKGRIVPVSLETIESIKTTIASGRLYYPWNNLAPGMRVMVAEGPLEGAVGVILRTRGKKRLVISVELMNVAVVVELENDAVEPYS